MSVWVPSRTQGRTHRSWPVAIYMLPDGDGVWFLLKRRTRRVFSQKAKSREVQWQTLTRTLRALPSSLHGPLTALTTRPPTLIHPHLRPQPQPQPQPLFFPAPHHYSHPKVQLRFEAMRECRPLIDVSNGAPSVGATHILESGSIAEGMASRSVVLMMRTEGEGEGEGQSREAVEQYTVDPERPGMLVLTTKTEIGSHNLVRGFNGLAEHYRRIEAHKQLSNIAATPSSLQEPIVRNLSFLVGNMRLGPRGQGPRG